MVFQYYNITFRRLEHDNIELLRNWRNAEWVRPFMHHRQHITKEMQENWFRSIDNLDNWVFIIEMQEDPIGVIYLRNMNLTTGTAEPGILMARKDPALMVPAAIAMMFQCEIGFNLFRLSAFVAHLYRDHTRSLSNQYHVGATIVGQFGERSVYAETLKESFNARSPRVRKALRTLYGDDDRIVITFEKDRDDPGTVGSVEKFLKNTEADQVDRFVLKS